MSIYGTISNAYDLLDKTYFSEKGENPRNVIQSIIPNSKIKVLDLCCGTLANTFSIAKASDSVEIIGVDLSKEMLAVAEKKCQDANLKNVYLKCGDATNTGFEKESFDYVIIGLVLHESIPSLREKILKEAFRVLKKDGKLIVLEWEHQKSLSRKLKFFPLYLSECLGCLSFHEFYKCNKELYFEKFNFHSTKKIDCNYSVVLEFEK